MVHSIRVLPWLERRVATYFDFALARRINCFLKGRQERGIEEYGSALFTFNGRNAERDFWEEIADAAMYAEQKMIEEHAKDPTSEACHKWESLAGSVTGMLRFLPEFEGRETADER